jgi:hypothetical protein
MIPHTGIFMGRLGKTKKTLGPVAEGEGLTGKTIRGSAAAVKSTH